MKNISCVISSHNKNILNLRTTSFGCNCWKEESCRLNGEFLTSQRVYKATVTNAVNEDIKKYIGLADTAFKERHSNHKIDVRHFRDFVHDNNYLNKKSELINKCRHFNKFLLRNVK